ncbi:MAG: hypothetical protein HUU60_11185 [Armatimonadetes bacterium]|nr:hypothetical protein [Armatimonadota bacterium]
MAVAAPPRSEATTYRTSPARAIEPVAKPRPAPQRQTRKRARRWLRSAIAVALLIFMGAATVLGVNQQADIVAARNQELDGKIRAVQARIERLQASVASELGPAKLPLKASGLGMTLAQAGDAIQIEILPSRSVEARRP